MAPQSCEIFFEMFYINSSADSQVTGWSPEKLQPACAPVTPVLTLPVCTPSEPSFFTSMKFFYFGFIYLLPALLSRRFI